MGYLVTIVRPARGDTGIDQTTSFEASSGEEATRIAQEGTLASSRRGESVTYEIHDPLGRLVMSLTSAAASPR